MIQLEHVSKAYTPSKVAVEDISLEIASGERLMLIGTSGSGKTTLLRMINRLITPSSGYIRYQHQEINRQNATAFRRQIGYVIQQHGLFPHYTVSQNIGVVPQLLGWNRAKIWVRTEELMDKFQIPYQEFKDCFPAQLSGGQKQRVGLARALAARPPVLLMDEPFGALDLITRVNIRQQLLESDELKEKTIIMVTHDMEEAVTFGDRICLLHAGSIQQTGSSLDLLWKPANAFTQDFFQYKRFELELKAIRLTALSPYLPEQSNIRIPSATDQLLVLQGQNSLWEAFAFLIGHPQPAYVLIKTSTSIYLIDDVQQLIRALQLHKNERLK